MGKLKYKVLYNQDGSNLFLMTKESIEPEHVDAMVDEVAEGGADLILVCPNAQRVVYPSRVWDTYWAGEKRADLPLSRWVSQARRLAEECGCDYLERALGRCRQRGIGAGVTIRMNDMHG